MRLESVFLIQFTASLMRLKDLAAGFIYDEKKIMHLIILRQSRLSFFGRCKRASPVSEGSAKFHKII